MLNAVIGGVLIGLAAVVLYLGIGRIAGISGIAANVLERSGSDNGAVAFLVSLMIAGSVTSWLLSVDPVRSFAGISIPLLLVAGFLVGIGTRLGSGCTSGHGVCGISRLSIRSLVATLVFLGIGMLIATGLREAALIALGAGGGS